MKIGLVIYGTLDILSGGYLYDRKLVAHLRQQGHEVAVFSQPQTSYVGKLKENSSRDLIRQIWDYEPDILLQDELNHPSLFLQNRRLKKRFSGPIISIVHHLYTSELAGTWYRPFFQTVEKAYLNTVDGFIFNSRTTQSVVKSLIGPATQSVVALPGKDNITFEIDETFIKTRSQQQRPLQVVFVGNVTRRKSLHLLVKGLSRFPSDRWSLSVVGNCQIDPHYVKQIKVWISQQGLTDAIMFLGKVSNETLAQTLLTSDILAVPSSYEGFGIVYVEALGAGLPVIAGDRGGSREIVQPGNNGFLVAQDHQALAEALKIFINERPRLLEMSFNALQQYKLFPTWDELMGQIGNFLEDW